LITSARGGDPLLRRQSSERDGSRGRKAESARRSVL
jgi:hypothetical protein